MVEDKDRQNLSSIIPNYDRLATAFFSNERLKLDSPVGELIMSYYGDEINQLEGVLPNSEGDKYTSLLKNFYHLIFDPGLSRSVSTQKEKFGPVYLLTRSAWIDQIEKRLGENFNNLIGIVMIDIADLSKVNQISSTYGDLLLVKAALGLEEALRKIEKKYQNYWLIPCRYGGDEFSIAVIKKSEEEEKKILDPEQVLKEVKSEISSKKHFYKNNEGTEIEENISLKLESTKVIEVPDDEISKKIFFWSLNQGSVLDEKEIAIFKKVFDDDPDKIEEYLRVNLRKLINKEYPLIAMQALSKKHPELAGPLFLADVLDQEETRVKNSPNPIRRRLKLILRLIDRSLNDCLLNDRILSFADFKDHLSDFNAVIGIEMKFIKELNDHYSMVLADEIIKSLYQKIIQQIPENEQPKIQIFRRGGSFFIGIKEPLDQETSDALKSFKSLEITSIFDHQLLSSLSIPLATVVWEGPVINNLDQFIKNMDDQWYRNIKAENPLLEDKIKSGNIFSPEITDPINQLTLNNLFSLFFLSKKRGEDRRRTLLTS